MAPTQHRPASAPSLPSESLPSLGHGWHLSSRRTQANHYCSLKKHGSARLERVSGSLSLCPWSPHPQEGFGDRVATRGTSPGSQLRHSTSCSRTPRSVGCGPCVQDPHMVRLWHGNHWPLVRRPAQVQKGTGPLLGPLGPRPCEATLPQARATS